MEDGDNERRDAHARQFINQFKEVHEDEQGAVGGQAPSQVSVQPVNPANLVNVQIVNLFNLANITLPIAPKWKHPDNLVDEFHKFKWSCQRIFDAPMCHISSGKV